MEGSASLTVRFQGQAVLTGPPGGGGQAEFEGSALWEEAGQRGGGAVIPG